MSTILVPYDHAMRLGMRFNTYTHSLCVNDAVVKSDKKPATEEDLVNKPDWGNISQQVTYTTKYVDKVSDVLSSLNISGSLEIKLSAIGAGGQAKASFIDTKKFKESDLNFLVQVKVVNSKLIADDVIEFNPIGNVVPSQFTEVYGDSFISGFVEGGELNGLVSIKLRDSSKATDIQASLQVNAPFAGGAVDVKGEGTLAMQNAEIETEGEKTVSVSWAGGGDIKPPNATEWTVEALKDAAYVFPSLVATIPQRIYAIVTKYSSLRSYQVQIKSGTPLDYENAGTYTTALLEAYLEYKSIWTDLHLTSWDLEHNLIALAKRIQSPSMTAYSDSLKLNFKKQQELYDAQIAEIKNTPIALSGDSESDNYAKEHPKIPDAPLPPNPVDPYEPDLFGLDQAHTDCRFEMIKIVREVDAVTFDPKVAIDPTRVYQFLSPQIFRLLIPSVLKSSTSANDAPRTMHNIRFRVFNSGLNKSLDTGLVKPADPNLDASSSQSPRPNYLWSYASETNNENQILRFWKTSNSSSEGAWLIYDKNDKVATVVGDGVQFASLVPGMIEQEWSIGGSAIKNGSIRIMSRKTLRFIAFLVPKKGEAVEGWAGISLEADSSLDRDVDLELAEWDKIPVTGSMCTVPIVSKAGVVLGCNTYHQERAGDVYDLYETRKRPDLPDKKSRVLSGIPRTNMAAIVYLEMDTGMPQIRLYTQNGTEIQEHCADLDTFGNAAPRTLATVSASTLVPISAVAWQPPGVLELRVHYVFNNKLMEIRHTNSWFEAAEVKT